MNHNGTVRLYAWLRSEPEGNGRVLHRMIDITWLAPVLNDRYHKSILVMDKAMLLFFTQRLLAYQSEQPVESCLKGVRTP